MTHPGLGVMIQRLGGNQETVNAVKDAEGKKIRNIAIIDFDTYVGPRNYLLLIFDDGTALKLWDGGQSCCENRYMNCDDALDDFLGATFQAAEIKEGPTKMMDYREPQDSEFLAIHTSVGQFTVVNYNEHNGYYGGFAIKASTVGKET